MRYVSAVPLDEGADVHGQLPHAWERVSRPKEIRPYIYFVVAEMELPSGEISVNDGL